MISNLQNGYCSFEDNRKLTDDIYLSSCGIEKCPSGYCFSTGRRRGYHLHVILSGEGTLCVGGIAQELRFGQLFITKPGEDTWYRADEKNPWSYCWMTYDGSRAIDYTESAGFSLGVNALECNVEQRGFYTLVQQILNKSDASLANELSRLGMLMEYIALTIESNSKTAQKDNGDNYVDYAVSYIRENYATARIADIARRIGIDRSYLSSIFKKKVGISPQEYLMQCRLKEGRRLLVETPMSIQEVADRVGYKDPLAFSKLFKCEYGVSPLNFRRKVRDTRAENRLEIAVTDLRENSAS